MATADGYKCRVKNYYTYNETQLHCSYVKA